MWLHHGDFQEDGWFDIFVLTNLDKFSHFSRIKPNKMMILFPSLPVILSEDRCVSKDPQTHTSWSAIKALSRSYLHISKRKAQIYEMLTPYLGSKTSMLIKKLLFLVLDLKVFAEIIDIWVDSHRPAALRNGQTIQFPHLKIIPFYTSENWDRTQKIGSL